MKSQCNRKKRMSSPPSWVCSSERVLWRFECIKRQPRAAPTSEHNRNGGKMIRIKGLTNRLIKNDYDITFIFCDQCAVWGFKNLRTRFSRSLSQDNALYPFGFLKGNNPPYRGSKPDKPRRPSVFMTVSLALHFGVFNLLFYKSSN